MHVYIYSPYTIIHIHVHMQICFTMKSSDYRTFGLSNFRIIEPSDYRTFGLSIRNHMKYIDIYLCEYIYMYIHICKYLYLYMSVCMYVCMYVCIYVYRCM